MVKSPASNRRRSTCRGHMRTAGCAPRPACIGSCASRRSIPATVVIPHSPACSRRSEEHTSELQSLMRISYAVFCLKKKKYQLSTEDQIKHYAYLTQYNPLHYTSLIYV